LKRENPNAASLKAFWLGIAKETAGSILADFGRRRSNGWGKPVLCRMTVGKRLLGWAGGRGLVDYCEGGVKGKEMGGALGRGNDVSGSR